MCTLTWWRGEGGEFAVFFNRDELKTRTLAEAPREFAEGGVRFLSPRDPQGGGTWMLANEHGVVVCLLNRWHEEVDGGRDWLSRGRLVWGLADVCEAKGIEARLQSLELENTKPFSLWAFDQGGEQGWDWSGGELSPAELVLPVTSSSFRFDEVAAARRERFAGADPAELLSLRDYHGGGAEPSAFTVRMCRPDAQTMSRSEVRVRPGEVAWRYLAEQADLAGPPEEFCTVLERHSS